MDDKKLYTISELAGIFGVSNQTIHTRIGKGKFPNNFTVGDGSNKRILVPAGDVIDEKNKEAGRLAKLIEALGFPVQWGKAQAVDSDRFQEAIV